MNSIKSYAQNFEDVMLWRALGHIEHGRYVDVGAQDPLVDSVSMAFYERGWRGIHVEPVAAYADKLRAARPGDTVIQSAVGARRGTLTFHEMHGTGLSTLDEVIAATHASAGFEVVKTVVPVITLDDVLACEASEVHWLKVDVEGAEGEVLGGWSDASRLPWVVLVESVSPLDQKPNHSLWEPLLLAKGYRFVYFDGLNRFYVSGEHPELIEKFSVGPNCFDGFALSGTATSTFSGVLLEQLHQSKASVAVMTEELQARGRVIEAYEQAIASHKDFAEARDREIEMHVRQERALQATIDLMTARNSELEAQSRRLEQHADRIEQHALRASKHAAQLVQHTQWLEQHSMRFERHTSWLETSNTHLSHENQRLQLHVDSLLASTSWKVTAPLRLVRRALGAKADRSDAKLQVKVWLKPRLIRLIDALRRRPVLWRAAKVPMELVPSVSNRLKSMASSNCPPVEEIRRILPNAVPAFRSQVVVSRLRQFANGEEN